MGSRSRDSPLRRARGCGKLRAMTTPQDPPRRKKQKRRREKQLAAWREKQAAKTTK